MSDYSESEKIANRLKTSTRKLHELAAQVGAAKQVREFCSDQRKSALSMEVVKALKAGESAAAAEHIGRASEAYQQRLQSLAESFSAAESTIAAWTAEQASYEAARSLLSFSKETMRNLDG
jgi:hypothetical protein